MISGDLAFYVALGFGAQLVDGALGMAYGLITTSVVMRVMRSSMVEILGEPYVVTAHSKGLHPRTVALSHVM